MILERGQLCGGQIGSDAEGRRVIACAVCDRGTDGETNAPNATVVCSGACLATYERLRRAEERPALHPTTRALLAALRHALTSPAGDYDPACSTAWVDAGCPDSEEP